MKKKISEANKAVLGSLVAEYDTFPWYKRLFFPSKLERALYTYKTTPDIGSTQSVCEAFYNTWWVWKLILINFFNCFAIFSEAPLMQIGDRLLQDNLGPLFPSVAAQTKPEELFQIWPLLEKEKLKEVLNCPKSEEVITAIHEIKLNLPHHPFDPTPYFDDLIQSTMPKKVGRVILALRTQSHEGLALTKNNVRLASNHENDLSAGLALAYWESLTEEDRFGMTKEKLMTFIKPDEIVQALIDLKSIRPDQRNQIAPHVDRILKHSYPAIITDVLKRVPLSLLAEELSEKNQKSILKYNYPEKIRTILYRLDHVNAVDYTTLRNLSDSDLDDLTTLSYTLDLLKTKHKAILEEDISSAFAEILRLIIGHRNIKSLLRILEHLDSNRSFTNDEDLLTNLKRLIEHPNPEMLQKQFGQYSHLLSKDYNAFADNFNRILEGKKPRTKNSSKSVSTRPLQMIFTGAEGRPQAPTTGSIPEQTF